MQVIKVGVRELKAHLSEYLRKVKQGQTIVVTHNGQPIGRILPTEQPLEDRIQLLAQSGLLAWNGQKLKRITPGTINRSPRLVSDLLVEMRK